jgi:hypothetical protein
MPPRIELLSSVARGRIIAVTDTSEQYEYGYRLPDGTEYWERFDGHGRSRILPHVRAEVGTIQLDDNDGTDIVDTIREALRTAGQEATILRRYITTTVRDTEEIDRVSKD